MKKSIWFASVILNLTAGLVWAQSAGHQQDWTNYVRIGAYGLKSDNADAIIQDAKRTHVFGIEVDNDIPGRYESFLDPTEKLEAIRTLARKAHDAGNYAFVYIAGTECITANADKAAHTLAKDHPDWLQRKLNGDPAIFDSGAAFWIAKGDEDVWVSPYAPEWRKTYMERIRQIAATGIDGIYVDIPYWMTHFTGWEDTWASFDTYTVEAFRKKTGLDARKDLKLGDFDDPNFRRWIDFRIETITEFLDEIGRTAKSVNPQIKLIPEIYPGIEQEAVRVGADVYSLYPVVDAIAHEYEFGEGDHMASSRSQLDWFNYQVGMHSFRSFADGKATWILNYSWDGDKNVVPRDAMKLLAMSQVMAGANFWDAPGHSMAGSNDEATRTEIFRWIEANQNTFYKPRSPMHPVGVYFSPATRNRYPDAFLRAYRGILILLMQSHREFQIVTPRTLDRFKGDVLVLPDIRAVDEHEQKLLSSYVQSGRKLVVTGEQSAVGDAPNVIRITKSVGAIYEEQLQKSFVEADPRSQKDFLNALGNEGRIRVDASPQIATSISSVEGRPHVFLANFAGLKPHEMVTPRPQRDVTITIPQHVSKGYFLPFLGQQQELKGVSSGHNTVFHLPEFTHGAVFWWQ
jgi:hypothetical protein